MSIPGLSLSKISINTWTLSAGLPRYWSEPVSMAPRYMPTADICWIPLCLLYWNKRTDQYGGDFEGRMRIFVEILQRIKQEGGKDFPVGIRFALKQYMKGLHEGGLPVFETFKEYGRDIPEGVEIAKYLEKAGYDVLHVDAGSWEARYFINVPLYLPYGCMIDMAEHAKKAVKIPVIGVGRINNPELAEQYLQEGKADMIALGRPLLSDAYWPTQSQTGKV